MKELEEFSIWRPDREEICAWCGRHRPLREMLPLVSHDEEIRLYHCRREYPCLMRQLWRALKTRSISGLYGGE